MYCVHSVATESQVHSNIWMMTFFVTAGGLCVEVADEDDVVVVTFVVVEVAVVIEVLPLLTENE